MSGFRGAFHSLFVVASVFFQTGSLAAGIAESAVVLLILLKQVSAGAAAVLNLSQAAGAVQAIIFLLIIFEISV